MTCQNIWAPSERELYKQKHRAQLTAFYLDPQQSDIILDIGCGEGFVTSHFTEASFVVGVEVSKEYLSIAKSKLTWPNVDFICADATALPIRTAVFNKIALLEVLEHLPENSQGKLIHEIDRILKKGGILIISVPYREQITYTRCIHCGKSTPLWGHLHSMDEDKVTNLLPSHYSLVDHCHFPNVGLISLSRLFKYLPLKLWLIVNNLLGKIRKGYWLLLKYKKV